MFQCPLGSLLLVIQVDQIHIYKMWSWWIGYLELLPPLLTCSICSPTYRVQQWRFWWNDPQPPVLHDLLIGNGGVLPPGPVSSWLHAHQHYRCGKRWWSRRRVVRSPEPQLEPKLLWVLLDPAAERGEPAEGHLWRSTAGHWWILQNVS